MNDFNKCNKITGVLWLKNPVENIKINVKLRPQDGILSLPKFEDYANDSNNINFQKLENKTEEYLFKWQEKVFSSWELQRYSDVHNCLTDIELTYHDMIKNLDLEPSKIFTYIHEDYHLPLPIEKIKINSKRNYVENLNACLEIMHLDKRFGRIVGNESSSMRHLFRSEENIAVEEEQWTAMHVIFDNSEYNEDSQLLLKQEATLLSLFHNTVHNYLIISPDVNSLESNPYTVEMVTGVTWGYQYAVEVAFEESRDGDELVTLLRKLLKKWEKKQKQLVNFVMPPFGKKQCFITLEIVSATQFDTDNLYIEFDLKIPESVLCNDDLHGRTHVTKALTDDIDKWQFGHTIEFTLEISAGLELPSIDLFLEVISIDWWGRHRTEGYAHLALTPDPGRYAKQLSCTRPEEMDGVEAESRRFFIGGCHLIKNLDVLAKPQLQDANFKYVTTGNINIRWNAITQAHIPSCLPHPRDLPGTSSASALLQGAETVLRKYRKARARLAAATEDLQYVTGDGSGDG